MSLEIPLAAVPSQRLSVPDLNGQNSQINVYQKNDGLYFDLFLDGVPIVQTHICRSRTFLLRAAKYLGYIGDFIFIDTQGDEQPFYTGLGTRWVLVYVDPAEFESIAL